MKLTLSTRDRYAAYLHLNGQPVTSGSERRSLDRIWTALDLDPIAWRAEAATTSLRFTDFPEDAPGADYELSSDQRDQLIAFLEPTQQRPQTGGLSRFLHKIQAALIKSRDGDATTA